MDTRFLCTESAFKKAKKSKHKVSGVHGEAGKVIQIKAVLFFPDEILGIAPLVVKRNHFLRAHAHHRQIGLRVQTSLPNLNWSKFLKWLLLLAQVAAKLLLRLYHATS